tara:strand:- start:1651 stop:2067 length:417 start_codon:yes stop_codon:yes gene_type:complete
MKFIALVLSNKLFVVVLANILVYLIYLYYNYLPSHSYYLLSAGASFFMFMVCIGSKDKLLNGYAYIQLISMCIYVTMITPQGFYSADGIMYDGVINYANVILLYEILLFTAGVRDVLDAMHWYYNDYHMHSHCSKRDY